MKKRFFSFLLCICFLLSCVNTTVFADAILQAETLTIDGPSVLVKPGDGSYSKVKYELLDESKNKLDDVKWSVSSGGLIFDDRGYAILGSSSVNGKYTVTAEYKGTFYSKDVNVINGVYEDFNSGSVGDKYQTGTRSATYNAKVGDDSDLYVSPDNSFFYIKNNCSEISKATQDVTFEYDIMSNSTTFGGFVGHVQTSCAEWAGNIELRCGESGYVFRIMDYINYAANGNKGENITYESDIEAGSWVKITMKMKNQGLDEDGNLKDHKWDFYANGELIFSDITMRCIGYIRNDKSLVTDCTGISKIYSYGVCDNIAIYTGDKFDPDTDPYYGLSVNGESKLGKPRTSGDVTSSYTLTNFLDNNIDCSWSIKPADKGVSISSDGTVSVTKDSEIGTYEIIADYGSGKISTNLTIENVDYVMSISGDDSVTIDYGFTEKNLTYSAADQFGIGEDCNWSVSGDSEFVTISDGILTVKNGAQDGIYTITATPKDENSVLSPAEKDVTVKTLEYELAIGGNDKIALKSNSDKKTETYSAKIIYIDDETVAYAPNSTDINWTVSPEDENVKIENGVLTVGGAAEKGTYTITAAYNGLEASKEISVEGIVYSVSGSTSVIKPQKNFVSAVKYSLTNNFGENITEDVEWSCDNAEILSDGRVLLTPQTKNYIVTAKYYGNEYKLDVSVKEGIVKDYEEYDVGGYVMPAVNYGEIVRADAKSNKSKYMYTSYTDSTHRMYLNNMNLDATGDDMIFSYDCFANPGESFGNSPTICDTQWIEAMGYKCDLIGGKYVYTFSVEDYGAEPESGNVSVDRKTYILTLDENDWVHAEIAFDTTGGENGFDMYINGELAFENIHMRYWNQREFRINNILAVGRFDNFASHSGHIYDRKITYTGTNSMPISSDGESRKKLKYAITDEGTVNLNLKATWEITGYGDDFVGEKDALSISGDELVAASPVYGTVYIKGTVQGMPTNTGDIEIKLSQSFSQMNSDNSSLSVKGSEGDEYTVRIYAPNSGNYIDSTIGYSQTPTETTKITVGADELGVLNITYSKDGMYYITVTDKNGIEEEYTVCHNCTNLFAQSDVKQLLDYEKINEYFNLYADKDVDIISKSSLIYSSLSSEAKDKVIEFADGKTENYFVSVFLVSILSGDKTYVNECVTELKSLGYDSEDIELLINNKYYSDIAADILEESDAIESALENIHSEIILIGVEKYDITYKEVKPYLARVGSSKYNNAADEDKDTIANAVAGKKFASLAKLIEAINDVDISKSTGGGGGGSSSSGGKKTSGGTIGSYIPNPTPETKNKFSDVGENHWAFDYIESLASKSIIDGYNDYFYPDNTITRAEFVKILVSAFGIEKSSEIIFNDVLSSDWYLPYVSGAAKAGLVLGSDGNFSPNDSITREDACVMIYRFAKYAGIELPLDGSGEFADGNDVSAYASDAVTALASAKIVNGVGNDNFAPKASTTRAAAAKIIYLLLSKGGIA